jgi:hypothetical protein
MTGWRDFSEGVRGSEPSRDRKGVPDGPALVGFGAPKVMKMGASRIRFLDARNGRGRYRSGAVEAVRESDPGRAL